MTTKQAFVGQKSHREWMTSIMENGSLTFQKRGISGSLEWGIGSNHFQFDMETGLRKEF